MRFLIIRLQNPSNGEFGLVDEENSPCLVLKFHARLYNFNLNSTDIATELADFTLSDVRLAGFCALHNEVSKRAQVQADWSTRGRRKTLLFEFREVSVFCGKAYNLEKMQPQKFRPLFAHLVNKSMNFVGSSTELSTWRNSAVC